jgi:hypothetical protein
MFEDKFKYVLNTEVEYRVMEAGIVVVRTGTVEGKGMTINSRSSGRKEFYSIRQNDKFMTRADSDLDVGVDVDNVLREC